MAATRNVIRGRNCPSEVRLDAEEREGTSGHRLADDRAHRAPTLDRSRDKRGCSDSSEDVCGALAQVLDVGVRHRIELAPAFSLVDVDQRPGVVERRLVEEHGVRDPDNRRVCADANGQ